MSYSIYKKKSVTKYKTNIYNNIDPNEIFAYNEVLELSNSMYYYCMAIRFEHLGLESHVIYKVVFYKEDTHI